MNQFSCKVLSFSEDSGEFRLSDICWVNPHGLKLSFVELFLMWWFFGRFVAGLDCVDRILRVLNSKLIKFQELEKWKTRHYFSDAKRNKQN